MGGKVWDYEGNMFQNPMKKVFLFGLGLLVFPLVVGAAPLPLSTEVSVSVMNISQDNADAKQVGARPGDILRYALSIRSESEDVVEYVPQMDIGDILERAAVVNAGMGEVVENILTFPVFTKAAPYEQEFTFFVRVKSCSGDPKITFNVEGVNGDVQVQGCALASSGASQAWGMFTIVGIGLLLLVFWGNRKTV